MLGMWLGWGDSKLTQDFSKETSWKMSAWKTEKDGHWL